MVLNKKGQTLILFIILIPIILITMALVIDIGLVMSEKAKLKEITKMVIKDNIDFLNEESIKSTMEKNEIDSKNLKIESGNNTLIISNKIEKESIFGKIIGIKNYKIKIKAKGFKNGNNVIIEF